MEWISVEDRLPTEFKVVLTQHIDDLYPVAAFYTDGLWFREIEGPEDMYIKGRHDEFWRSPTHWKDLSDPPKQNT